MSFTPVLKRMTRYLAKKLFVAYLHYFTVTKISATDWPLLFYSAAGFCGVFSMYLFYI